MQQRRDALLVRLDPLDQVLLKAAHPVAQDPHAVQQVADQHGLEDVELELAVHARDRHRRVVAHDLRAHHGDGLALRGVDLPRHDGRAGLVLRQLQLAEAAAGAGAQVADVLRDLEQRGGEGVERGGGVDDGVVGGEGFEFVGGGAEGRAGHAGDLGGDGGVEAGEGVEAGTDGGAALGEEAEVREGAVDTGDAVVELGDVAGEFLAEGEGGGVLEVGAPDLDDLRELLAFGVKGISKTLH